MLNVGIKSILSFASLAVVGVASAATLEIPQAETAPVIDGVSAAGEWEGALRLSDPYLHSGISGATGEIDPRRCDVSVLWDDSALYLRCRAETAPGNRLVLASGVHSVYMDDNFELHFDPPAAFRKAETKRFGVFQLIVNAAGETFARHENPGYGLPAAPWKLKGTQIASKVQDDVWTLEMAIPAKVLGGEKFVPGEWGFIFSRNYRAGGFAGSTLPAYAGGGYEKPESYARMTLSEKGKGKSEKGKADDGFCRPKADVDWGDLSACVNPAELGGKEIDGFLKWYPSLNAFTLDLTIDSKRLNEELTLKLEGVTDYPVKADGCRIHRVVPVGRTLADGTYCLSLVDANGEVVLKKSFQVKAYPWQHANKGLEQILLPGFTVPKVDGTAVSCVLRRYDLGKNGFPREICAKDQSILAEPVALWGETNGSRTDLGQTNHLVVDNAKDLAVTWRSEGPVYTLRGRLEQDGLIRYDLDFAAPPAYDRIALELRLKDEQAILFHASGEGMRTNPAGFIPRPPTSNLQPVVVFRSSSIPQNSSENFIPYCWIGADERGVAFAADTDEGWLHDEREQGIGNSEQVVERRDAVEIVRHPNGDVSLVVNFINGRLPAEDLRRITFAVQASPVKPRPEGWRGWSDGFDYTGTVNANGAWSPSQWGCFTDWSGRYPAFEDWSYVRKMVQIAKGGQVDAAYYTNWIDRVAKADAVTAPWLAKMSASERRDYVAKAVGRTLERAQQLSGKPNPILYPYTCNRELTKALPENVVMKDEWEESESVVVSGSYREYALYYLDKMIENGFNGVYDDNTYFYCNFSWATGDAWIDRQGTVHPSYGLWNSREYHRRQATLLVQHGHFPWITAHHTNANILPTLGFVANTMGMEWKYGTDDFQNRFTPDYIRAVCAGGQGGFYPTVLDGILKIEDRAERRRVSRTMLASLLPHEVRPTIPRKSDHGEVANVLQKLVDWGIGEPDCTFAAYYDAACPVAVSDTNVLVSVYRRGDRYLAVCGSWTTNDVTLTLALKNGAAIRCATDVETGARQEVHGDTVSFDLKRHDLAMIELDCGPGPALDKDNPCMVYPQSFTGGWALDSQFLDVIGSPCLIAHGMGRPVPDARAVVELPEPGRWRIAVRAKNWLPADSAYPVDAADYPGTFRVLVDGHPLAKSFGRGPKAWTWEDGGEIDCRARRVTVTLRDEDGFDGRCAGVVFYRGTFPLSPDAALDVRQESVTERTSYDLVVVGGGVPGCCAAIAAARAGLRVALVQDRPVLGGNSSSEIRVYSAGEQRHPIVKEMRSLFMNRDADNAVSDAVRRAKLEREPNLSLFLSHRVFAAEKEGSRILAAKAIDLERNRIVAFEGRYFVDATGDGWLGFYAGADYRQGREARDEFGESFAPEQADRGTLGASLMWKSSEANVDVPFAAPWAEPFACGKSVVNGEWNWEYGLDRDVIGEGEQVRDRLLLAIYGAFSNAKRESVHARRILTTLPFLLGKRESRRLMGDWIYRQADVEKQVQFEDAVATGSWSIDLHYVEDPKVPFITRCEQPHFGRYWIPYRSIYSRNVENLFMVGRCFSCTHVGLGGPRVNNTLSQLGVAAGTAAAMCCERGETPRQLFANGRMRELQRRLGGDWPGNPDPARRHWAVVDDEDASVAFVGNWSVDFQCNGGQVGNRTHTIGGAEAKGTKAVYSLPVAKAGRYCLKGNTPWCWGAEQFGLGEVALEVVSGSVTNSLVWNQSAGNGDWADLGVFDLKPGARLIIHPEHSAARVTYADAFALVSEQ